MDMDGTEKMGTMGTMEIMVVSVLVYGNNTAAVLLLHPLNNDFRLTTTVLLRIVNISHPK